MLALVPLLSATPTPAPTVPSTPAVQSDDDDTDVSETRAAKRHKSSPAALVSAKKGVKSSTSGLGVMESMNDSISTLAESLHEEKEVVSAIPNIFATSKESVTDTLLGQAAVQLQEASCLTEEGVITMMDVLTEPLACKYLALQGDSLKALWLKKQLEKAGADMATCWVDWSNTHG